MTDWVICYLKHSDMSDAITDWVVCHVQSDGMTDKEHILMKLQHQSEWDAQFDAQLDNHHEARRIGEPVPCTSLCGGHRLCIHWYNIVKCMP